MKKIKGGLKKKQTEKRNAVRMDIPLRIKYMLPDQKVFNTALCDNVSGTGIRLRMDTPLKRKDRLKMLLHFPGISQPITTFSRVVWCEERQLKKEKSYFDVGFEHIKTHLKDRERFVFGFCEMMLNYFMPGQAGQF